MSVGRTELRDLINYILILSVCCEITGSIDSGGFGSVGGGFEVVCETG